MRKLSIITLMAAIWGCPPQKLAAQYVDLGTASNYGVLAGSTVTNTGSSTITGDVGVSPGLAITGFPPGLVNGTIHAGDASALQAQNDLTTAYNDAAGRAPTGTIATGTLGGLTLVAGTYSSAGFALDLTGVITLNAQGNANAVWIFQAGSSLITASNSSVLLINGAQACHVFWQVGSSATLGTNSSFQGNILANTSITANTGAVITGRLLARNGAVTLDTNTILEAICAQLVQGSTTQGGDGETGGNGPSAAELKRALIVAAQWVDMVSAQGLTSIYTLGFAQFDTEVFSLQQRLADIRAGTPNTYNPMPLGHENGPGQSGNNYDSRNTPGGAHPAGGKNPIGGKNPRSGKNSWGGKSAWDARYAWGGNGIQPKEVQLATDDRWGFFITGTGDFLTAGDADGTSVGTTLGVDRRLGDHFVIGVSIGYSHAETDLFDDSKVKSDGVKAAIYGMYQNGGFFTEGLIGTGYNNYDTKRSAFLGDARGDTYGVQFDAYLGMGYDLKVGYWTVTPMVSLLYTRVGIEGFHEVGSLLPLDIATQDASSLRIRVGPRIAYNTQWGGTMITPSVGAQWQHEFLDEQLPFDARFANDPDGNFTVYGPKIGRDSLLLTAALNFSWRRYATYLAYQANLARENYENHTALAGFRVSW